MEIYTIYRKEAGTNKLSKTSYSGEKRLMKIILRILNRSESGIFHLKRENGR